MGYQLRDKIAETLGPEITGNKRLIIFEIAGRAPNSTRTWYGTLDQLARWTGIPSADAALQVIKRLAADDGIELRREAGKRADGRPIYERRVKRGEGTVWTLVIPEGLVGKTGQSDPSNEPRTVQIDPSDEPKTGQSDLSTGQSDPSKPGSLLSSVFKGLEGSSSSSVPARTRAALVAAGVRDEEEESIFIEEIRNSTDGHGKPIKMPYRYINTLDANGDLPARVAANRAARAPTATQTAKHARPDLEPHCGACGDVDAPRNPATVDPRHRVRYVDGYPTNIICGACHPDAAKAMP